MLGKCKHVLRLIYLIPGAFFRSVINGWSSDFLGNHLRRWYYNRKFDFLGEKALIHEHCAVHFPKLIRMGARSSINHHCELNAGPAQKPIDNQLGRIRV